MNLQELQETYFALSPEQREVLLAVERETLPSYASEFLVPASKTYKASASRPVQSIFDFDYSDDALSVDFRRTLEIVVDFARKGEGYCFASIGTLAEILGVDRWTVNYRLRRLAQMGWLALTKEPARENPDASNPYHWRLKSYLHPILIEGELPYISRILKRCSSIASGLAFEWKGEKKSEIVDNLLSHQVVVLPTVEGEKRPAFTALRWQQYSKEAQRKLLLQSSTGLIIQVPAGITVLDFDSEEKLKKFIAFYPELRDILTQTLVIKTPRGFHVWFKAPVKFVSHNNELFDVRSEGSWLVVPSGDRDRFVYNESAISPLPKSVIPLLEVSQPQRQAMLSVNFGADIPTGNRNNTLFRVGRSIRRRYKLFSSFVAEMFRQAARCVEPLPQRELYSLIRNAWNLPDAKTT